MAAERTIRLLTTEEIGTASFWQLLWYAAEVDSDALMWIRDVELPRMHVIGEVEAGDVVSFVAFRVTLARVEIEYIAVDEGHRRSGGGTALLAGMRAMHPDATIYAETDDDAVGFYRRCGFSIAPAPADSRWPGRVRYACTLAASARQ